MIDPQRDAIIDKVRYGQMTPEEAEAEAARLNLEHFERRPKPEDFDPMRETYWTLPMAVAWIAYRTSDEVRQWWNSYRSECWDWHFRKWRVGFDGPIHEGHVLEQRATGTLVRLELAGIFYQASESGPVPKMSVKEAKKAALWVALREGLIESTGINARDGRKGKDTSQYLA